MRKHKQQIIEDLRIAITAKGADPRFVLILLRSMRDKGMMNRWIKSHTIYEMPKKTIVVDPDYIISLPKLADLMEKSPHAHV